AAPTPTLDQTTPKSAFVPQVQRPAPILIPIPSVPLPVPAAPAISPVDIPLVYADIFASFVDQLTGLAGDPTEIEHGTDGSCDLEQHTTFGVVYWRCDSGLTGFAAAPDGLQHWARSGTDLMHWAGFTADPPAEAIAVGPEEVSGAIQARRVASTCAPSDLDTLGLCLFPDGALVQDRITQTDGLVGYRVDLAAPAQLVADLTDLPADYDLFLADPVGDTLGASMSEDTTPEHISLELAAGTYYLYVHVDAARTFDPNVPYTLGVAIATPAPLLPLGAATP
ncbi:MAG: PPC domain-containing protein, partial [Chloroflexi bacterium]|nr:PPC domain-containing protein [Chloroflexota bacterium]